MTTLVFLAGMAAGVVVVAVLAWSDVRVSEDERRKLGRRDNHVL